LATPQWICAS